jgi:hypothetical protein
MVSDADKSLIHAVILVETTPLQTPIWALVLAIGIATVSLCVMTIPLLT